MNQRVNEQLASRFWVEQYREGVPHDITAQLDRYRSINHYAKQCFEDYADRVAFENAGSTMTYGLLAERVEQLAAWLERQGVVKGDRVAIMLPNSLQYPVCLFAAMRIGAVVVNINPLYTPHELAHVLEDATPKIMFVFETFAHTVEQVIDGTSVQRVVLTQLGDLFSDGLNLKGHLINFILRRKMVKPYVLRGAVWLNAIMEKGARPSIDDPCKPEDIAFLQYTGGTTGRSKGAMLTHRNILANCTQVKGWFQGQWDPKNIEMTVSPLPLYHVYSLVVNCLIFMGIGGHNILITNPRDCKRVLKMIRRKGFTGITAVNTLFQNFMDAPEFADVDFSKLKLAMAGGAALQKSVALKWHETTGTVLSEGYGLTECSPIVTMPPVHFDRVGLPYAGNVGVPIPSTEIRLITEAGAAAGIDEPGELWVRGPQVMKGYWQRPAETADVLDEDGWLRTGDVAVVNSEGYVKIVDRLKDLILVSGFNVFPNEIEDALAMHPDVVECAVVGVPHDGTGEKVKAVVYSHNAALSLDELRKHCEQYLTRYKLPTVLEVRDEPLPKTPVGKILRKTLREEALAADT